MSAGPRHNRLLLFGALWLASGEAAQSALQQRPGLPLQAADVTVRRAVVAGGGSLATGGILQLRSTSGQTSAGLDAAVAGNVVLQGGYWHAIAPQADSIFSDGYE